MNAENNSKDRVEELLKDAAGTFAPPAEVKAEVRERLMSGQKREAGKPRVAWFRWRWRIAGAASAALAALVFLTVILWPAPLTLAEVKEAFDAVEWIHVKYENGTERWISATRGITAWIEPDGVYEDNDDDVRFLDRAMGVEHYYHGRGKVIYVHKSSSKQSSTTAWDATVGPYERMAEKSTPSVERQEDVLDGRAVIRFDSYFTDAFGERLLVTQIWADPQTRLPVKIRRRVPRHERPTDSEFKTAVYSFPQSGPESIYDLGVPRSTRVIDTRQEATPIPEEADALLAEIKAAEERFLEHYRVVTWGIEGADSVEVLYFSGRPTPRPLEDHRVWRDFSTLRARQEHYFNMGAEHPEYHLPMPATVDEVLAWTQSQTPADLYLADGNRTYYQSGPLPPMFHDPPRPTVGVHSARGNLFPKGDWPTENQWPLAHRGNLGNVELLPDSSDTPAGTIGIRITSGDIARDYYVDPARDHLCVRLTTWEKLGDGWFKDRETTLQGLVQLPTGHWVATTRHLYKGGDPDRNIRSSEVIYTIDLTPLTPEEFPPDIFSGEKLLEEARQRGVEIETY